MYATAKKLSQGNAQRETQMKDYSPACVEPAYKYFKLKFDNELKPSVEAFKAGWCFSPAKITKLKPTALDTDMLNSFSFLKSGAHIYTQFKIIYMAAVEDVSSAVNLTTC